MMVHIKSRCNLNVKKNWTNRTGDVNLKNQTGKEKLTYPWSDPTASCFTFSVVFIESTAPLTFTNLILRMILLLPFFELPDNQHIKVENIIF